MRLSRVPSFFRTSVRIMLKHPVFGAVASGALLSAAFYLPYGWPLIFIALVPFLKVLPKTKNLLHAFWVGMAVGALLVGVTSLWMFSYSVSLLANAPFLNFLGVFASWTILVLAMSPLIGIWALVARSMGYQTWIQVSFLSVLWVVAEFARMGTFMLVTLAPGVSNPPFFSIGFLGNPLAENESWLQLASLGGVYLMSFAAVLVNLVVVRLLSGNHSLHKKILTAVVLGVFLISALPLASVHSWFDRNNKTIPLTVGIMSVYVPPTETITPFFKTSAAFKRALEHSIATLAQEHPQVILLPEDSHFLKLGTMGTATVPVIVDSGGVDTPVGSEMLGYTGSLDGTVAEFTRGKRILTPQGEYLISIFRSLLPFTNPEFAALARKSSFHTSYSGSAVTIPGTALRASVIFCIEMVAPGFGKYLVNHEKSQALFFTLSHGGFHNSYVMRVDTFRFVRLRTVEAGVPSVVSGDHTPAYAFDKYGRVLKALGREQVSDQAVVEIPVSVP